jgi:glycosyltransferase involved in cell wall biosynthesis
MICVSDAIRESLVKDYGFAPDRTFTIYNGVCLTDFGPSDCDRVALRRKLRIGGQEFLFVSAARLSEQKRVDLLLTAMARLLRSGFQCKCLLVGDGPLKAELVRHAQELSLVDHVIFAGFHHDVRPYLQAADAFVLTSCREGLPLSIVEAMACGLPCVVTDVGGNREAVHHNVNGLVVPSGAVEAIADAMQYLIVHREKCAQMGRLARLRAADTFNMELLMGKIKAILLARPLASTSSNA